MNDSIGLRRVLIALSVLVTVALPAIPARAAQGSPLSLPALDASTRKDALHALDLGLKWLEAKQDSTGYWSMAQFPALTALAVSAILRDPRREAGAPPPAAARGL